MKGPAVVVGGAVVLLLCACSGPSDGDRAACQTFVAGADSMKEQIDHLADGAGGESDKAAYREFVQDYPSLLRAAANEADSDTLAADLESAATYFAKGGDDATTAYYLTETQLRDACS